MKALTLAVAAILAVSIAAICYSAEERIAPADDRIHSLELRVEVLTSRFDALQSQVARDSERGERQFDRASETAKQALDTTTLIFTWIFAGLGAVGALLGFFGYRDVEHRIDVAVRKQLAELMADRLDTMVRTIAEERLRSWDDRFAKLALRAERVIKG